MEEKKEPIKIRLSTAILSFIILILIIAIIGIAYYYQNKINTIDKVSIAENKIDINSSLKNESDNNNVKTNNTINNSENNSKEKKRELDIKGSQVQELYKKLLKSNDDIYGEGPCNESFYKDSKTDYNTLSNVEKIIAVIQYIKDTPTETVNISSINGRLYNDYYICTQTAKLYSKQLLENAVGKIFGNKQDIQWKTMDSCCGYVYDYIDGNYYGYAYQGGGFGCRSKWMFTINKSYSRG